MANEEQVAISKQGVDAWNDWHRKNPDIVIDLSDTNFVDANLQSANLFGADLSGANLSGADLSGADLSRAYLMKANLHNAILSGAILIKTNLQRVDLSGADLLGSSLVQAEVGRTVFGDLDLRNTVGLDSVIHVFPSRISTDTFVASKGKIPDIFLRGCGLSDWEIEAVKLYNPELTNEERNRVLYKIYDLQTSQAIQISPLFISYSHADGKFVDKLGNYLQNKGIRYWRDTHELKAGRIETQIDRGIHQNPTLLLVLSEHSLNSDWVEYEARTARQLEKDMGRDVLCPVALDDSWKSSHWPKRIMEQITEYNILDFSEWKDNNKFDGMFRKLIDGLELFYKG